MRLPRCRLAARQGTSIPVTKLLQAEVTRRAEAAMGAGVPCNPATIGHNWTRLEGGPGFWLLPTSCLWLFFPSWICTGNGACKQHLLPRVFSPFSFL